MEVAVTAKKLNSEERNAIHETGADFCRIFKEDMKDLYLLAFLLTADPAKAEQCFVAGLDDCASGSAVFKEWARSWARRAIVKNAVRLIAPESVYANGVSNTAVSSHSTDRERREMQAEISVLQDLVPFERFAFVMSVLEGYSDQDCALLLGCTRKDLIAARVRALQAIVRPVAIQSTRNTASVTNQEAVIDLTFPAHLAIPA
jgi:DNA-directed RNA polymerase specialized sigma24 family protein